MLKGIKDLAEIRRPSDERLNKMCRKVMEVRNRFAHRQVGVDWGSQDVSLYDAKKRKWEKTTEDVWHEHQHRCEEAVELVRGVLSQIVKIRTGPEAENAS